MRSVGLVRTGSGPQRWAALDAARGVAMVWMTVFHGCFDLQQVGWLRADFYHDGWWTGQRVAIVSLFLLCAGAASARTQDLPWARFGRRWLQVLGAAALVSAGSYLMFPASFIYFGVLHGMALMLLLTRLLGRWLDAGVGRSPGTWLLWPLGALLVALPQAVPWLHQTLQAAGLNAALLDGPALNWLGLMRHKPITEDHVPLLPWWGVMLWGLAAGRWAMQRQENADKTGANKTGVNKAATPWAHARQTARQADPHTALQTLPQAGHKLGRGLVWLGQHSLVYYLVHQPVMIGVIMAARWVWG